jgi:thiol-disulfide isomerase/thioredoxin
MEELNDQSNHAVIQALKPLLTNKHIVIVWGTWCGDSRLHVPHFYKILEAVGFPEMEVTLIDVNQDKKPEVGSVDHLNIERVPTFIIFEADKELGRIVERPKDSLEQDLLEIVSQN